MTIKDDLLQSRKLDPRLRARIRRLPDNTDPDVPLFGASLEVRATANLPGTNGTGSFRTAHQLSLNQLKALADSDDVFQIQGSSPMFPEQSGPR